MRKIILLLLLISCMAKPGKSQVIFHFLPEVYARNLDGLSTYQIQNMTGAILSGQVLISVKENTRQLQVVEITTPVMQVNPGTNTLSKSIFGNSVIKFGPNVFGQLMNQTRNLPAGEYTICFSFVPTEKGDPEYENCFDASVEPLVPMQLLLPANQDTICSKRPLLSWQPPMPYNGAMYFRLMLAEKKQAKNGVEAMIKNMPLLLLDNISTTTLMYPSNYPELKEGSTYYWQVVAYQQNIVVSTSEVWEFTVKCKEESLMNNDSYRELKQLVNGNYYITSQWLKFSFLNNYNIKKLQYTILDVENGGKPINGLPELTLTQGLNKVDIDISDLNLKQGKSYILRVFPFNESPVEVRFIYQ